MGGSLRLPMALHHCRALLTASPAAILLYLQVWRDGAIVPAPGRDVLGTLAAAVFGFGDRPRESIPPLLDELAAHGLVALGPDRIEVLDLGPARREAAPDELGPRGGKGSAHAAWLYRQRKAGKAPKAPATGRWARTRANDDGSHDASDGVIARAVIVPVITPAPSDDAPTAPVIAGKPNDDAPAHPVIKEREAPPPPHTPPSPKRENSPVGARTREAPTPEPRVGDGAGAPPAFRLTPLPAKPAAVEPPPPTGLAGEVYRVLRGDAVIAAIVAKPHELAVRLADRDAYPALDPVGELKRACAWLAANPAQKKKRGDRYLTNWFDRAQEKARPGPRSSGYVPAPPPAAHAAARARMLAAGGEDLGDDVVVLDGLGGR